MNILIRRATKKDEAIIVDWIMMHQEDAARTESRNVMQNYKKEIDNIKASVADTKNNAYFFAYADGKTVGIVRVKIATPLVGIRRGQIKSLHVDKKYRRKGVGHMLIEETIKWLKTKKMNIAEIVIRYDNTVSQATFRKYKPKPWFTVSTFKI
ncbi:GNAT family N-acetyltransferase [Patescibacteria group bacterium]|nr:GNAT family N-acetyltransferase [Patescibacteria group bacterium]